MLHNFWFMASKFPNVPCPVTEFYADSDEIISFSKFWFFLVVCPKYSFELVLAILRKLRGRKISKFRFSGSIFNAQKYGGKIFPKFELFGFFRNQVWDPPIWTVRTRLFAVRWTLIFECICLTNCFSQLSQVEIILFNLDLFCAVIIWNFCAVLIRLEQIEMQWTLCNTAVSGR